MTEKDLWVSNIMILIHLIGWFSYVIASFKQNERQIDELSSLESSSKGALKYWYLAILGKQ